MATTCRSVSAAFSLTVHTCLSRTLPCTSHTATLRRTTPPQISPPEKSSPPPPTRPTTPLPALPEEAVESPALLEEMLEQIFLRLPPDEPACLVRTSLASKLWLAHLTGPRFRRLYRERHASPRMLGFLASSPWDYTQPEEVDPTVPPFFSTTGFRARVPDGGWGPREYTAWDCRHGRVLLGENNESLGDTRRLAVWDPVTGRRRELEEPEEVYGCGMYYAAVLCAVTGGCHHLACHEVPFTVVHISLHKFRGDDFVARARVSSPEKCASVFRRAQWSDSCPGVSVGSHGHFESSPPVLVHDALHFILGHDPFDGVRYVQILKYEVASNCLSVLDAPNGGVNMAAASILLAMEDGSCLGFAHLETSLSLFIWSRQILGSDGVAAAWTQRRVVHLENLLPVQNPGEKVRLIGSVEGSDVVFVATDHLGIYKIDLKVLRQKKISDGEYLVSLIPYMSLCNPQENDETLSGGALTM